MLRIFKYGNWTMPKSKRFFRKSWVDKPKEKYGWRNQKKLKQEPKKKPIKKGE
jgi:hypothetical protein